MPNIDACALKNCSEQAPARGHARLLAFCCSLRHFLLLRGRVTVRRCMTLNQLTISELVTKLAKREVSSRAAVQACLDQIQRVDLGIRRSEERRVGKECR